jgi:hypothetical protein
MRRRRRRRNTRVAHTGYSSRLWERKTWDCETRERGLWLLLFWRQFLVDEAFHFVFHLLLFLFLTLTPSAATVPGSLGFGGCFPDVVSVVRDIGFAGPGSGPEFRRAVVGAGCHDVSQGMPVQ